jgi:DNA gyrase subunit B
MSEELKQVQETLTYDENSISVLEGLEAVRKRPGMYIGSTGTKGLHHLVYEIVDNSIDEAVNGTCDTINVIINQDNSITNVDNGRGIPCGIHPKKGISTLEVVLATLHAGGKFGDGGYKTSGGLHGVGSSVVNALSKSFIATVHRDNKIYQQHYSQGKKLDDVSIIGTSDKTGTTIDFTPDDTIFNTTIFDYKTLANRFKELAFLNKKITINFEDKRENKKQIQSYHYDGGLKEFVNYLNENKDVVQDDIIYIENRIGDYDIEISFQYTDNYNENVFSFANNINTTEHGYHVNGFYSALVKTLNDYARKNGFLKEKDENFQREDVKEGLTAVISVKLPEPEFEGQTKTKLGNTEIQGAVSEVVKQFLEVYINEHKDTFEQIIDKVKSTQDARLASKKAKELAKKKNSLSDTSVPPSKVAFCTGKDKTKNEFIVVEGNSGAGSAKQARDRRFQTIMGSKGKIMNTEKQKLENVLDSVELKMFAKAIGTGMGDEFDISKLNHNFILMLQDADVDGYHIQTLWMTYIYRYMRPLIENGHLYLCVPPLYRTTLKDKSFKYTYSEEDQSAFLNENKDNVLQGSIQRYKGLGEMDAEQLWDTTLNPETRVLLQVTMDDAIEAEKMITLLMGDKVPPRKEFIKANSNMFSNLDI